MRGCLDGWIVRRFNVETMTLGRAIMSTAQQLEKEARRIADAIVTLVERTDGPVTLARLDREIPGFSQTDGPSWEYYVEHDAGETVIWEGMTEAGHLALRKVISGRRVAIQPVNLLPYLLEER